MLSFWRSRNFISILRKRMDPLRRRRRGWCLKSSTFSNCCTLLRNGKDGAVMVLKGNLSNQQSSWLERPFEEEVWGAVKECSGNKAPGADGFTMRFYRKCWAKIKGHLMSVMEDFYRSAIVNMSTNETYICLILIKSNSWKVKDFRPISLVTSLYKIISKVLANRLQSVLHHTIAES